MTLLPGAVLDPGAHWNYQAGYSSMDMVVWHYTVGRDSRALIRNNGLSAVDVWDDVVYEFAPLDAVTYTQCEWNRVSAGYEVESIDGSLTPGQIANLGYLTLFTITTWGIPDWFYDGPRMPVGNGYRGVTCHRNLIHNACDMHSDGFDRWVWDQIHTTLPPTLQKEKEGMLSILIVEDRDGPDKGKIFLCNPDTNEKSWIRSWEHFVSQVKLRDIVKYVGGTADNELHSTSTWVGDRLLWMDLLDGARDIDTYVG